MCFALWTATGLFYRDLAVVIDDFHSPEDFLDRFVGGEFQAFNIKQRIVVVLFLRNNVVDGAASAEIDHFELGHLLALIL